ncbi:MAG TPA: hypothetical protein VIU86_00315, partial [Gaiellaceae bacterium]
MDARRGGPLNRALDVAIAGLGLAVTSPALAVAALAVVAVLAHGTLRLRTMRARMAAAPSITVGIVQPNVDQSVKNRMRENADWILSRLVPLTVDADRAGADLVAWPEATYPLYLPSRIP